MAISGHKTAIAFKKYIKATRIKKVSMIKELWNRHPDGNLRESGGLQPVELGELVQGIDKKPK